MRVYICWCVLATAIWLPTAVQSQNEPSGLTAAAATRNVKTAQELADAWADPTVLRVELQGDLTIDPSFWRDKFSATGGMAVLAHGSSRKNFTIAGGPQSSASINFQMAPNIFMVGAGGVLHFDNVQLHNFALTKSYKYSPEQPYRAAMLGPFLWPTIGLAPRAKVMVINVKNVFRNPDPTLSCEETGARDVHALRQLPGRRNITLYDNNTGGEPGERTRTVKIVNGSDSTPLGEATYYKLNLTWVCLPATVEGQLFGKLAASQFAVAVSVPVGVVVAAALALLALCIRRHRRKHNALEKSSSSSTLLKDVESGLRQQSRDQVDELRDSICSRRQPSGSSTADSLVCGVLTSSSTDDVDDSIHVRSPDSSLDVAVLQLEPQMQGDVASDSQQQLSRGCPTCTRKVAAASGVTVGCATSQQKLPLKNDDSAYEEGVTGVVGCLPGKQQMPCTSCQDNQTLASTRGTASLVENSSQPGATATAGRVCSPTLIVGSSDSSHLQQPLQHSGTVTASAAAHGKRASSSTSRRLSNTPAQRNGASGKLGDDSDAATTALLKTRSDIAVLRDLKIGRLLGTGSYGRVYKGRWKSVAVAVKVMEHHSTTRGITSSNAGKLVMAGRETALASSLAHPNVVQTYHISTMTASQRRTLASTWMVSSSFIRYHDRHQGGLHPAFGALAADDDDDIAYTDEGIYSRAVADVADVKECQDSLETWLIMEFCELGSLERVVKSGALLYKAGKPDLIGIYKALLDIASGLDYLHSMGVVHGDLKTANVLLKGSTRDVRGFACKITDFGISRVLEHDATHVSTQTHGTITYMPQEVLLTGRVSKTTDIYSFGLMMWELYAGCSVYEEDMSIGQLFYMIAYSDWRPDIPSDFPPGYSDLMKACWHQDPEQRPTAQQLLKALQKLFAEARQAAAATEAAVSTKKSSQSALLPVIKTGNQQQRQRQQLVNKGCLSEPRCEEGGSSHEIRTVDPSTPSCSSLEKADALLQQQTAGNSGGSTALPIATAAAYKHSYLVSGVREAAAQSMIVTAAADVGSYSLSLQHQQRRADKLTSSNSELAAETSSSCRQSDPAKNKLAPGCATTVDTAALAAAAAAAAAAAVAAVLQQGVRPHTADICSRPLTAVDHHLQLHSQGASLRQEGYNNWSQHPYAVISAGGTPRVVASNAQRLGWQQHMQFEAAAARVASVVANAATLSTSAHSSRSLTSSQAVTFRQQQQQQQHLEQQLSAYYHLPSNSLQQQPLISESVLAVEGFVTTSTTWHDCSSGGSISQCLVLQDSAHVDVQAQPQDLLQSDIA